jgi:hypothetical protein
MAAVPSPGSGLVGCPRGGAGAPITRFVGGVTSRAGVAAGWARRDTATSVLAPSVGVGDGALGGAFVLGGAGTAGAGATGSVTAPTGTCAPPAPGRSGDTR